mmetsp:Transcript_19236/g.28458  ORF Transcript_19236/g.28458 Transcript_19236/m.28458 type:complete len:165 (-) Transcript_19236:726-1220(-)|eukprot:CAMPEP_0194207604 /NCGR_PEP_ID=MMETSP0156-20130528/6295_1 /TAXON_ID=33649 /ORGANISM="Thalassionema nitzschioides, Strain L26-B" /LENGTH=164 /DNA_ID=CAMNT_0038934401 /DNA_START=89 /DNA_END=583 /DNA_ORIENTATION=+
MTDNSDPAAARRRRKEIMQSLRAETAKKDEAIEIEALPPKKRKVSGKSKKEKPCDDSDEADEVITTEQAAMAAGGTAKKTTVTTADGKKKTQIRYDPEVPMSKDQLAAWRREARRVRNRESAAASRQRIRDRINELEGEVDTWKERYAQAVDRLAHLERLANGD